MPTMIRGDASQPRYLHVTRAGRLQGRTCLIVGGTSGIGLATARRFLEEGARVVVCGRSRETVAQAQAEFRSETGLGTDGRCRRPCAGRTPVRAGPRPFSGRLDVLFHVAGISGRRFGDAALHECTVEGWDTVLEANARSVFLTNRAAVRQMLTQPLDDRGLRGTVLNMGSVLGWSPAPDFFGTFAYAASKGAIRAMTLNAAARYARDRIRFNLIAPGLIETPMAGPGGGRPSDPRLPGDQAADGRRPGDRRGLRRGGPLPLRAGLAVRHRRGPERRRRLVRLRRPDSRGAAASPPLPSDDPP